MFIVDPFLPYSNPKFRFDKLLNGKPKPKDMPKSFIAVKFVFVPEPSIDKPVFSNLTPAL